MLALGALPLLCAATLCAGVAHAARPHEFERFFSSPGSGPGQLQEPDGVAVNEATGDVYVVDKGNNRVEYFSAEGTFIAEFAGTSATGTGTLSEGSATISSVLVSSGAFNAGQEITAPGLPAKTTIVKVGAGSLEVSNPVEAGKSGVSVELKAQQGFETAEGIAVDNSCVRRKHEEPSLSQSTCESEDPSNGDVYVIDGAGPGERRVVDKYTATGEYLNQITGGAEVHFGLTLDGVAVNQLGEVFIFQETPAINRYSSALQNEFNKAESREVEGLSGFGHPGFALDGKGNYYLAHGTKPGVSTIAQADPTPKVLRPEFDPGNASAVAVDPSTDHVLIDDITSVAVRDTEANLFERLGQENGAEHLQQGAGLAIDGGEGSSEGSGDIYVADAAAGHVAVFVPALPSAPKVEGESFAEVGSSSALLQAQINPHSESGEAPTEYRFQYGRCSSEGCAAGGYEASTPTSTIAAGFENQEVSARIEGLAPHTTYHFRALVKNSHSEGEEAGPEDSFLTEGAGGELVLADERGWELVSPPDKHGALIEPITQGGVSQAAADGGAITYLANLPTEEQPQGFSNEMQVLSRRGAAAWSSLDIGIPHGAAATGGSVSIGSEYKFFDPALSLSAVQPFGEYFALSEESSEPTAYLHDLSEGCDPHCYRPLVTGANVEEGVRFGEEESCPRQAKIECGPEFVGASKDLAHVVLRAGLGLAGGAGPGLYEWSAGVLSAVSVLPGGGGEENAKLGAKDNVVQGAISTDGSLIVWSRPTPQSLFERDTARGETVQLDAAEEVKAGEPCSGCESGGAIFQFASADGSRVFFIDSHKLSEDAGAEAEKGKADLYECKVAVSGGKLGCELTDLTPLGPGEERAEVQGGLLGASEDGSYLYLVAKGVLSEEANGRGAKALKGQPNLYELHEGQARFVATLAAGDGFDWNAVPESQPTRASASGRWLAFMSEGSPTGYDNRDLATGRPVAEVYLYDATEERLVCASCQPSGTRPVGVEAAKLKPGEGALTGGPREIWPEHELVGANVAGWTVMRPLEARYQPRYLSDQGRLFFNTINALAPQDENATQDVYEYEPAGLGSCSSGSETYVPAKGGCVSLISSGSSAQESAFLDASESGGDVFFLTSSKLSPLDSDGARDVYDAHICTSERPCITFPETQVPPCSTEASCKAPPSPQPSIFGAPSSETFQGTGNLPPQPQAQPPKKKTPAEIRAERLKRALKACRKKFKGHKQKHKRQLCERRQRRKYRAKGASKAKARAKAKAKTKARGR